LRRGNRKYELTIKKSRKGHSLPTRSWLRWAREKETTPHTCKKEDERCSRRGTKSVSLKGALFQRKRGSLGASDAKEKRGGP